MPKATTEGRACGGIEWQYCAKAIQIIVGSSLSVLAISVLILTLLVIYAQFKSGNLSKHGSPIFTLSTWQMASNSVLLAMIGFYCGPTIALQTRWPEALIGRPTFTFYFGQTMIALNFANSFFNIFIAINRALAIRGSMKAKIFSRQMYNISAAVIFPISFILSFLPVFLLPCCKIFFSSIAYTIVPTYPNYPDIDFSWIYVYRPFYLVASVIPVICYIYVFGYTFWMKRQITTFKESSSGELIRSILFAIIFLCYTWSWLYYEMIMVTVVIDNPSLGLCVLNLVFIIFESAVNALLHAVLVASIRDSLKLMLCTSRKTFEEKTRMTNTMSRVNTITILQG